MEVAIPGTSIQWEHHDCPDVGAVMICAWNAPQFCSTAVMIGILRWRSSDAHCFIMPNDVARGCSSCVRHSWQHKEAEAGSAHAGEY
eukprot:scaffold94868_cov104-Phaeocystis_antarctica.AAC.1